MEEVEGHFSPSLLTEWLRLWAREKGAFLAGKRPQPSKVQTFFDGLTVRLTAAYAENASQRAHLSIVTTDVRKNGCSFGFAGYQCQI